MQRSFQFLLLTLRVSASVYRDRILPNLVRHICIERKSGMLGICFSVAFGLVLDVGSSLW
jgi:hypothetical protein